MFIGDRMNILHIAYQYLKGISRQKHCLLILPVLKKELCSKPYEQSLELQSARIVAILKVLRVDPAM